MSEQSANIDNKDVGIALSYLREQAGMSQQEVADSIGTAGTPAIGHFEKTGFGIGREKLDKLPALFGCKSLAEMVQKANALGWEQVYDDRQAIGVALRFLREQKNMAVQEVADKIDAAAPNIGYFEKTGLGLGREKLNKLPALFDCMSLKEMAWKAGLIPDWEPRHNDRQTILRHLRARAGMTPKNVDDKIDTTNQPNPDIAHPAQIRSVLRKEKPKPLPKAVQEENVPVREPVYDNGKDIGIALRYLREQADMSLQDVADGIGAAYNTNISHFEETGRGLGKHLLNRLPDLFACTSLSEMVQKANDLTWEQVGEAKEARTFGQSVAIALRYLREQRGMTFREVAEGIGAANAAIIDRFERTNAGLGKKLLNKLPALFGCQSLQEMVQKANDITWEQVQEAQASGQPDIAIALHYLREQAGLSRQEVADKVGASAESIGIFERTGRGLSEEKIDKLAALFECKSLPEMVQKANDLSWEQVQEVQTSGQSIAIALRCLRKQAGMSQGEVADKIGASDETAISRFEKIGTHLGKELIDKLSGLFGCKSLQEMVQKANALDWEQGREVQTFDKSVGIALCYWREQAGISQREVARKIGAANASTISKFERMGTGLGKEKLDKLPPLFGFKHGELQKMVDKVPVKVMLERLNNSSGKSWFIEKEELRRHMASCMKPQKS